MTGCVAWCTTCASSSSASRRPTRTAASRSRRPPPPPWSPIPRSQPFASHCAAPGEAVRIVGALDAVQPCSKGPGGGGVFPGFVGPAMPPGRGETHVLRGAAVIAAGHLPRAQEAVIDMSGPARAALAAGRDPQPRDRVRPGDRGRRGRTSRRRSAAASCGSRSTSPTRRSTPPPDAVEELPGPGPPDRPAARASASSRTSRRRGSTRTSSCTGAACPAACRR